MASSDTSRPLLKKLSADFTVPTHQSNVITLQSARFFIVEMEDVLFHLDSAVMMPETPTGKSSTQGVNDNPEDASVREEQNRLSGINALAAVFKELQFDPSLRVLVTSHADTSANFNYNFKLTAERGDNVVFLLNGRGEAWAANCAARHRIEDYQQILTFAALRLSRSDWNPVKIDNAWGPDTENAVRNFLKDRLPPLADELMKRIKTDPGKKWPAAAWMPVYDLYEEALAASLGIPEEERETGLARQRELLASAWVKGSLPSVACGEMWPIDSKNKNNYRSQLNRRIEILFFDGKDEIDGVALDQCTRKIGFPNSTGQDSPRQEPERYRALCPLWPYKEFITPVHIDPGVLDSYTYHLRFVYYDRIRESNTGVPEGLTIHAVGVRSGIAVPLAARQVFIDGVYCLQIKPFRAADGGKPDELYFTFDAADAWIRTTYTPSGPMSAIERHTRADIEKLDRSAREEYHRLPGTFTTRNTPTWYDKDADYSDELKDGTVYEKVVKDTLRLRPFGPNGTTAAKPLTFRVDPHFQLDDIPAALLFPSLGCPAIVQRDGGETKLYCFAYGASIDGKPEKEITAERVNRHLKIMRWEDEMTAGVPAVLAAKNALLKSDVLPFEFDDCLYDTDEEARTRITVKRFDPKSGSNPKSGNFYRHNGGFYCGETVFFNLSPLGIKRFSESLDGVTLTELYQIAIDIPGYMTEGFYNLFWLNKGQEIEDLFLQRTLSKTATAVPGAEQKELLGPRLVDHLNESGIVYGFPVDIVNRTYSITNIDSTSPLCGYHPLLLTKKAYPGIACIGDSHVASRTALLTKSQAKVIESDDDGLDCVGDLVSDPFLVACDLLAKAGEEDGIDMVLITGDLIDYIKSFFPAGDGPFRDDDYLASNFKTQSSIREAVGFDSKEKAQPNYEDGVDFIGFYSLLVKFLCNYRKPVYIVAGNHDPYYWPWGISPRVGLSSLAGGGHDGNPIEIAKPNAGVPADANLTFYEAILAYGPTYGYILEAKAICGASNFKPDKFELFFTLFTAFADFALQLPRWSLTGLYWGNQEDLLDPISLTNGIPVVGPFIDPDTQGAGHLPRSDDAVSDSQLALLKLAADRPNVRNFLMTHFTFASYLEKRPLEDAHGRHGTAGNIEFDGLLGTDWEASEFDMGTFETNRKELYGSMLFQKERGGIHFIFTGHMHRRGLYDITKIDYFGDPSVKTRFWDITPEDFAQTRSDSARIFVPDSAGNLPRFNCCGEFKGWGSDTPSLIKCIFNANGTPGTVDHVYTDLPQARPRIAVALDYLYNAEGDDFFESFESERMDNDKLFDATHLDFILRWRHRMNEFDYRCIGVTDVRLYSFIDDRFYRADGQPGPISPDGIKIRFTFPSTATVSPRRFKEHAGSSARRTFISFRFSLPTNKTSAEWRALHRYNFNSRYNYEVILFHERLLFSHYFRIGRINQFTSIGEAITRRAPGNQEPDWNFRELLAHTGRESVRRITKPDDGRISAGGTE